MLKVEHVSKKFASLQAIQDINFTVHPGQIMGLIGQNGAGKTTAFHSILIKTKGRNLLNQADKCLLLLFYY